jgi:molecular chaperone HscB
MQWAVRVNQAYRRLKDPLQRGAYLCELRGAPIDAENNTAMPPAFLMQQMGWREALEDASGADAVEALDAEVARYQSGQIEGLRQKLDEQNDTAAAAAQVRALMFVNRFREDIHRRLEALDA